MTSKQRRVLLYIQDTIDKTGHSPTFQEMADALGYVSKGFLFEVIRRLDREGYLTKSAGRHRSFVVLRRITPIVSYRVWDPHMKKLVPHDGLSADRDPGERGQGRKGDDLGELPRRAQ